MLLALEPTNACNLKCLHCMRDKLEDRKHISLDVFESILQEAKSYGLSYVAITGGEPTLHPQLDELLDLIARMSFKFHIITNGHRFRSKVLPILLKPNIKKHLHHISISLDGGSARTHDANRGEGAFRQAMEMAALCKLKEIPFNLITVINNFNKNELLDIALLGSGLGAIFHLFGPMHPTPVAVREGLVASPEESKKLMRFVTHTLFPALKMPIAIGTGTYCTSPLLQCGIFKNEHLNVDYQANAIFCCTLSHPTEDDVPHEAGEELLADLKLESVGTAIVRQKLLVARLTEERLRAANAKQLGEMDFYPCHWCFKRFGKLAWLKEYPDSPWARGMCESRAGERPQLVGSGVP